MPLLQRARTRRSGRGNSLRRLVVSATTIAAVALGVGIAAPPTAAVAEPVPSAAVAPAAATATTLQCSAGYVYAISSDGQLQEVAPDGTVTSKGKKATGVTSFNGLGITADGSTGYAYERAGTKSNVANLWRYDAGAGTWTDLGIQKATGLGNSLVAGGVDLSTGDYYFGGFDTLTSSGGRDPKYSQLFKLWKYSPASGQVTLAGSVDASDGVSQGSSANGDLAFNSNGDLFIVRGSGKTTTIFSVAQASLAAATGGLMTSAASDPQDTTNNVNGVAFDANGIGYLGAAKTADSYKMPDWTSVGQVTSTLTNSTDLASCSSPPTVTLQKNVLGRVKVSDQFTLSMSQGTSGLGSATTAGTSAGIQPETVGPLPTASSATLSIAETAAGTTDLANYVSSYQCTADGSSAAFASGTKTSGSFTVPAGAKSVVCTFTNSPLTANVTINKKVADVDGKNAVNKQGWIVGAAASATSGTVTAAPTAATQSTDASGNATWALKFGAASSKATLAVSETQQSGYDFASGQCVITHLEGTTATTALTGATTKSLTGVVPGDDVQCGYVNKVAQSKLTLVKKVVNDDGGTAKPTDWTLSGDGPTPISGTTGASSVTAAAVNPGTYTLLEKGASGYTGSSWDCGSATVTGGNQVTVAAGADVTCTVTNDDQSSSLTLRKTVENTHGGTAKPADFTLNATSAASTVSGAGNSAAVTKQSVAAGTYTLSESGGPAGYVQDGAWDCGALTVKDSKVVVPNGTDVTCTVTNQDQAATLTLKKIVDNGHGGTASPTDFTLKATGTSRTVTGVGDSVDVTKQSVDAGTYTLSEAGGPAGYEQTGDWTCAASGGPVNVSNGQVTVANGADVTCTVTNSSRSGSATWSKTDEGGRALKGAVWNLTGPDGAVVEVKDCTESSAADCTGPDKDPAAGGFAVTDLAWGEYGLVESKAPAGYVMDSSTHHFAVDGTHLTVAVGPVTNQQAPPVTLPLTGGVGTDAFLIGGGVLLVGGAGAGSILAMRRRRAGA